MLGKLSKHVARFIVAEEAMTSTEYAVMLALIVCLCMGPVQSLGCNARTRLSADVELDGELGKA